MVKMASVINVIFILPLFFKHEMFSFVVVVSSQSKCSCIKTAASDMNGPTECHTEWSQFRERRRNIAWHPLYMESKKKMIQMNLFTKQKETHRLRERTHLYTAVACTHCYIWNGQPTRTYCAAEGTLLNSGYISLNGSEFGGEWIRVYIWLSPFPVHLKLWQHC